MPRTVTDAVRFYRRASVLPFAASMLGGGMAWAIDRWKLMSPFAFPASLFAALYTSGIFVTIPYALFLLAIRCFAMPESEAAHRKVSLLAPIVIAVPFAVVMATMVFLNDHADAALIALSFYFTASFLVGYVYVATVELALAIAKRFGIVSTMRTNNPGA
ncbi:MAG: hypothetical protein ABJC26_14965 [Gemmatimonadaceae bacterium]